MKTRKYFRKFGFKVTLMFILAMLMAGTVSDLALTRHALRVQFSEMRRMLTVVAQTAALSVSTDDVRAIPLDKGGTNTAAYKAIYDKLALIKQAAKSINYIYVLKPEGDGLKFRFLVDVGAGHGDVKQSLPGDIYDASDAPQMIKGLEAATADDRFIKDDWGVFLSGYAPIKDKSGLTLALLGVDVSAENFYRLQNDVKAKAVAVLVLILILSLVFGFFVSRRITSNVNDLITGAKNVAMGNLDYKVCVKCDDEIGDLAGVFNKMSLDLKGYIEKLNRATAEKERITRELEIAKEIQQSFLPSVMPVIPGFDIAAASLPAEEVGGDFFDFIERDGGSLSLFVGDVSGKGIPAALFMALSKTMVHASVMDKLQITDALKSANEMIYVNDKSNMFVTLFYASLDPKAGAVQYVNAGHNPPVFLNDKGRNVRLLESDSMPLGVVNSIEVTKGDVRISSGDVLVIYTDGVTEAINREKEEFGLDRLTEVIKASAGRSAEDMTAGIMKAVKSYAGDMPQFDDMTLVVIKAL